MPSVVTVRSMLGIEPSGASTSDSVLIIVDAQNEYAAGRLRVANVDRSRAANASLLKRYRDAKAPVVHVIHAAPDGAPIFTPGTDLAAEFDELKPVEGESVVTKNFPGSFTGTDLEAILKATKRDKIVLTGYMAHVCISTTARQGHERGWDVTVVEDCVGDRDIPGVEGDELTRTVLSELSDFFATVVHSRQIF
ncbi:Isochorismatase family [Geosmithia morbida]|uniref:Isochorismatase family n=1 Tax=Geosmithia morbida TaxID=1094350 RepID=A0A9P4YYU2_9HYPO|nr:Isochorismatase family [Geosmithia morbida]KAF4124284.1 Isochorismatase family [Geosmithia morbida]